MRTTKIGHLFRAFIDQKNDQFHFRMIFRDRIGDVMQQCRLAGARRSDNQTALAHAQRRHQIHDPRGVTIRRRLQLDPFVRIDRRQFFKRAQTLIFRRLFTIDLEQLVNCGPRLPRRVSPLIHMPSRKAKRRTISGRDKNILWRLDKIAFRIAQKTEAFAGNFDDAFAEFRFGLNLFAGFGSALSGFSAAVPG